MRTGRLIRVASRAVWQQRRRSLQAALGVVVGVAATVAMVAVAQGTERSVVERIRSMGADLVTVTAGQVRIVAGRPRRVGNATTLRLDEVRALAEGASAIRAVAPVQAGKLLVRWGSLASRTNVVGTTPEYAVIRSASIGGGRYFDEEEVRGALRVAVVGPTVVRNVLGATPPIGETLRIDGVPFSVVGVLAPRGLDVAGQDQDDVVLVPITTALRRVFNLDHVESAYVQAEAGRTSTAMREVRERLRERHHLRAGKGDDFTLQDQVQVLGARAEATRTFTWLTLGIACIALLIGGVGILAVMLIAVRERVQEIGLRRAVGATAREVSMQFALEAAIIGAAGGVAGAGAGFVAALAAAALAGWPLVLSVPAAFVAVLASALVGVAFGVAPARRAAAVEPSSALRSSRR